MKHVLTLIVFCLFAFNCHLHAQVRKVMSQADAFESFGAAMRQRSAHNLIQALGPEVSLPVKKGQTLYTLYLMKEIEDKGIVVEQLLPVKNLKFFLSMPDNVFDDNKNRTQDVGIEIVDNKVIAAQNFDDKGQDKNINARITATFSFRGKQYSLNRNLYMPIKPSGGYKPKGIRLDKNIAINNIGKQIPVWVDIRGKEPIPLKLDQDNQDNPNTKTQVLWQLALEKTLDYKYFELKRNANTPPDRGLPRPIPPGDYTLTLLKKVDKQDLRIRLRASSLRHTLIKEVHFNLQPPLPYIEE